MRTEQLPWDSVPGPHYAARELKPRKKWVTVGGWILVAVLLLGGLATRYRVLLVFSALYALALLTVNSGCTATLARRFSHGVTGF